MYVYTYMCVCTVYTIVSKYIVFMYSSQITECTFMHLYITMYIYIWNMLLHITNYLFTFLLLHIYFTSFFNLATY